MRKCLMEDGLLVLRLSLADRRNHQEVTPSTDFDIAENFVISSTGWPLIGDSERYMYIHWQSGQTALYAPYRGIS